MRRLIATLMGISGLLIMTVSSSVADPQGKKIALVITNVAQAYIATIAKSVTDTGKRFGMEVTTFSSSIRRRASGAADGRRHRSEI